MESGNACDAYSCCCVCAAGCPVSVPCAWLEGCAVLDGRKEEDPGRWLRGSPLAAVCVLLQLPRDAVVRARLVPSADAGCMRLVDGIVELVPCAEGCDGRRVCDRGKCRLQRRSVGEEDHHVYVVYYLYTCDASDVSCKEATHMHESPMSKQVLV